MKRDNKGKTIPTTVRRTALSMLLSAALLSTGVPLAAAEEAGERMAASPQITMETPLTGSVEKEQAPAPDAATALPGQVAAETPLSKDAAKATAGTVSFEGFAYAINPDGSTATLSGFASEAEGDVVVPSEITSGADMYSVTSVNIFGGGSFHR